MRSEQKMTAIRNLKVYFVQLLAILHLTSSSIVCPEFCECVTLGSSNSDEEIKVSCEWSTIDDVHSISSSQSVARLTIICRNRNSSSTVLSTKLRPKMFQSFVKLRHLTIVNCHLDHKILPKDVFDELASTLKTLHLENISTTNHDDELIIESNSLATLKSLEKLTISSSKLRKLPPGELCSLKELKSLNLTDNHLTSIGDIGFNNVDGVSQCQNQIVILDLDKNHITKIDDRTLNEYGSLRILRLNENSLQQIFRDTFKRTKQLRHLYISRNKLSNVDDLPYNLHSLDLSDNNLRIVPPTVSSHVNVQHLNLSRNYIDVNTPFVFESTQLLTTLDLSHNNLHSIPSYLFSINSSSIVELLLNNNEMRSLQSSSFKNLTNLKRLDLSNNKLSSIDRHQFVGVDDLDHLLLKGNALSKLDDHFFVSISRLSKLDMSRNVFIDAPKSLVILKNLKELDISRNSISSIPPYLFVHLENLTDLNLSGNKLTSIDRDTFEKMNRLQHLDLSDNAIERISTNSFDGTLNLRDLRLQNNLVRDISGAFANLQRLHILNLSGNRVNHLDLTLLPHNLNVLTASNNSIIQVTNFLPTIRTVNLRYVDFSYNKLEKLTSAMLPTSLEWANFSRNEIYKLDIDILNDKTNLLSLDLSFNKIQTLNQSSLTVKSTPVVATTTRNRFVVYLKENPFQCTCNMQWMKSAYAGGGNEVLYVGVPSIIDFDLLKCTTLNNDAFVQPISNVSTSEFLCHYDSFCTEDCNCCEFDFCDCKNVCPPSCSCSVDATSTINNVDCTRSSFGGESNTVSETHIRSVPMYATSVRLDGLRLPRLIRNAFFGRYRLKQLYLNDSSIENIASKSFSGLTSLEILDLSDNTLVTLTGEEFFNAPKLSTLFLNGNKFESLDFNAFINLPNLKYLTLHNNRFKTLPQALLVIDTTLNALTLSMNPWKCDCDDKYLIQTWLPRRTKLVTDNRAIYCFENLTESRSNASTILSVLPATGSRDTVKVNFWTFVHEINQTFCYPKRRKEYELDEFTSSSDGAGGIFENGLIFIPVVLCGIFLIALIVVAVWRFRNRLGKKFYDKYRGDSTIGGGSSLNSTTTTPTTPIPLLQYDAFVSYSKDDEEFVEREIVPQLEHVHPYYKLCLLHREFPANQEWSNCQSVKDDLIKAMVNSQRIITICSSNFLNKEWELVHIRTAYRYLSKIKRPQTFIMILMNDNLPNSKDDVLEHYLRISQRFRWSDKLFWSNFLQSMPDEPSNNASDGYTNGSSSHYSDLYTGSLPTTTTIVPSQLI